MSSENKMGKIPNNSGSGSDYDSDLQMFRRTPRPIDMSKLFFLRWLADQGRLEHQVAGPSSGSYAPDSCGTQSEDTKVRYLSSGKNNLPAYFSSVGAAEKRRTL